MISVRPNARVPTLLIDAHNAACFLPWEKGTRRFRGIHAPPAPLVRQTRRRELLEMVTDDLAANGLVDFSLRRAARAAGTTHKVLLYHFDGVDDLLEHAIQELRERRTRRAWEAWDTLETATMGQWVRLVWAALLREETRVLDQAIGLVLYDTERYQRLGAGASDQYLPALLSRCPSQWSREKKTEVSQMVLATLRGFLIERATGGNVAGIEAGLDALVRAVEREEHAD